MPRPPRRAAPAQARHDEVATTPTRTVTANAITAAIPPFMLDTPPHAPFLTTPIPPSNNPGQSLVPGAQGGRFRNLRNSQHTPTGNGNEHEHDPDLSQASTNPLGSNTSEQITQADDISLLESVHHHADDAKVLAGLRDISSLATWTLSSAKPGCALAQLRDPSPSHFWQSDGPQPHTLTLHFFKLVSIVKMRVYLDFGLDESYTPTKMRFFAGMSEGGLVEFGSWEVEETTDPETGETHSSIENIRGWIEIPLKGVGGRDATYYEERAARKMLRDGIETKWTDNFDESMTGMDEDDDIDDELGGGDVLRAMVVQVRICENHQNGKDTHVRGFQVFARDDVGAKEMRKVVRRSKHEKDLVSTGDEEDGEETEILGLQPAEWMGEPEIR